MKDVADARENYEKRMKQQASEEEERKRKAIEETLLRNVEAEKKKCARLTQLESGINKKEEAIANILKRKDQMLQVQKDALQSIQAGSQQLKNLMTEKEKIEEERRKLSQQIVERTLKRRAETLSGASSKKISRSFDISSFLLILNYPPIRNETIIWNAKLHLKLNIL